MNIARSSTELLSFSMEDTLTIEQLEEMNAKSIWVLNTSYDRMQGAVAFQVEGSGGKMQNVEVPFTFVAINLADYARPQNIIDNEHFRRAVTRRLLTIVSSDYARSHNSSKASQVELDKIARGFSVGVQENAETLNPSNDIKTINATQNHLSLGSTVDVITHGQGGESDPQFVVDQRILNIMNNEHFSEQERIGSLRTNKSYIKLVDAYFICRSSQANDEEEVLEIGQLILKQLKRKAEKDLGDDFTKFNGRSSKAAREALRS